MKTHIENSWEAVGAIVDTPYDASFRSVEVPEKKRPSRDVLKIIVAASVLSLGLALSMLNDLLFFKELTLAAALVGMVMLIRASQPPVVTILHQKEDGGDKAFQD